MRNPKTTIYGILLLVSAAAGITAKLLSGKPIGAEDITLVTVALAGLGFIAAQDGKP